MAANKTRLDQPRNKLADAIRCALSRWAGVTRFVEDGRIEFDNNAARARSARSRSRRTHRSQVLMAMPNTAQSSPPWPKPVSAELYRRRTCIIDVITRVVNDDPNHLSTVSLPQAQGSSWKPA
ncbi:IS66 family transposase [Bradyrhizobium sp. USDA 4518]